MGEQKHMKTITKLAYISLAIAVLAIGAPTANGELGDLFASLTGTGVNGGGFLYRYTSGGVQSTLASGVSRPHGLAFDHFGNLFATITTFDGTSYQGTILKITPLGVQSTFASVGRDLHLVGLAIDSSDNVFVMARTSGPNFASTIYKFTPGGVQSTFGSIPTPSQSFGLAFDEMSTLFAADTFNQTVFEFAPDGTRSVFVGPSAFDPDTGPAGLAFDRFGDLFVSTESEPPLIRNDTILKFTPQGVRSTFATGLTFPRGLAFDRSGNLFVADVDGVGSGEILKFTPDGHRTVFAVVPVPSNTDPQFLAFQLLPTPRPRPSPHPRPSAER
jgi:sugar lactone lactonase YvrE